MKTIGLILIDIPSVCWLACIVETLWTVFRLVMCLKCKDNAHNM